MRAMHGPLVKKTIREPFGYIFCRALPEKIRRELSGGNGLGRCAALSSLHVAPAKYVAVVTVLPLMSKPCYSPSNVRWRYRYASV
jgi:hypothetical protein